ncbi:MAG: peptidoglycan editing factor PgeF [Sphingomonadales bacterium]|jgi:YfiH family protein|nr:peptidoglycan editing factor PgeF [Sphingomonadales bacterium]MBK9004441.1 peptidoglycan editing factor PgeF [Sphingomonadales bacterium]MBK9269626.1 peptidoglycan editing factor PgeF [Sphingomonadales bacterium]MBP6433866.1 peptidoglycan editing factor PgeF [Sphingorhabdus sp.]
MESVSEDSVEVLHSRLLGAIPHGFLGRRGGISEGIHAGLNVGLGSDDDREAVLENRRRAANAVLPNTELVTVHQIHSPDVVPVAEAVALDARPKADAMVTNRPGLLLGILTADCVPVLFADSEAGVIGAAHAGWKGAISGVTDNTLAAMEKLGAKRSRIACAIGPCIAQKSYEVDDGFYRRFVEEADENERFFGSGKPGHWQFDIEGYVAARLATAGVTKVECLGEDTYSQPDRFFSYRRSCHRAEPGYGREISLIGLRG